MKLSLQEVRLDLKRRTWALIGSASPVTRSSPDTDIRAVRSIAGVNSAASPKTGFDSIGYRENRGI
ncbi:hypothetical protein [Paraburkholderia sp. BCC1885]|uniref:hypothetical protein n=1 Tax=Paraburkholderia sp. BCC1885 TaxID=2562669 RepID=UPI001182079B|nr:hypothetical protein [Paraburkholderia sp. BCC1885]